MKKKQQTQQNQSTFTFQNVIFNKRSRISMAKTNTKEVITMSYKNQSDLYSENNISKNPAIELLEKLGYTYISPEDCLKQRGSLHDVLLKDILRKQLHSINQFEYGVITAILDDEIDINDNLNVVSDISLEVTDIIKKHDTVDWQTNKEIHNKIAQDIDDMFYRLENEIGFEIDFNTIDKIIENVITVALRRFK